MTDTISDQWRFTISHPRSSSSRTAGSIPIAASDESHVVALRARGRCHCLQVENVQPRVALGYLNHERHELSRIRKANVFRQLKYRSNCPALAQVVATHEMAPKDVHRRLERRPRHARVIPVGGRVQLDARSPNTNEKFLNQEAVVEDDIHYWSARSGSPIAAKPAS